MSSEDKAEALKSLELCIYHWRRQREKFPSYYRQAREKCQDYPELLATLNAFRVFVYADGGESYLHGID